MRVKKGGALETEDGRGSGEGAWKGPLHLHMRAKAEEGTGNAEGPEGRAKE